MLNYIKINNQISTAGQPTKKEFKQIAKEGFEVVINLAMHNKGALNPKYAIEITKLAKVIVLWVFTNNHRLT